MKDETALPMVKEIVDAMTDLLGRDVASSMVASAMSLDKPSQYPQEFFDGCMAVFSKLIGKDLAKKRLQPIWERHLRKGKRR